MAEQTAALTTERGEARTNQGQDLWQRGMTLST